MGEEILNLLWGVTTGGGRVECLESVFSDLYFVQDPAEHILAGQIMDHMEANRILCDQQRKFPGAKILCVSASGLEIVDDRLITSKP